MFKMSFASRHFALTTALASIAVLGPMSSAFAHALWTSPKPRDDVDGWKETRTPGFVQPCGVARTAKQPVTTLAGGKPLEVKWDETVNHDGCFVIDFSEDDKTFRQLAIVPHDSTRGNNISRQDPRKYVTTINVPGGPCKACTLRLRQMMLVKGAACPPAMPDKEDVYYSCANVVIEGGTSTPDAGLAPDTAAPPVKLDTATPGTTPDTTPGTAGTSGSSGTAGTSGSTAGTTGSAPKPVADAAVTTPGDDSHTHPTESGKSGGCSFAPHGSGAGVISLLAAALLLRRRRRS